MVNKATIESFQDDGIAFIPGLFKPHVTSLRVGVQKNIDEPGPFAAENLKEGEALYGMFCSHCHGPEGNGGGSIGHPIYSNIPHYNDKKQIRRTGKTMSELKAGHIFHSITYGVNAMGPHSSQLSEDERWKLVMHVQKLQKLE